MPNIKNQSSNRLTKWLYIFAIGLLCFAGGKWVINSTYFPVKHIKVSSSDQPLERISEDQIQKIIKENVKGNILKVNLNQVKVAFEQDTWIAHAHVIRMWPDTISVTLTERIPVARWSDIQLVDKEGNIFIAPVHEDMPIFSGIEHSEKEMVAMFLKIQPILKNLQLSIKKLNFDSRSAWSLVLDNGILIKLGRENTLERIQYFAKIWPTDFYPMTKRSNLEYIDMRYKNGFAIKEWEPSRIKDTENLAE